MSTDGAIRLFNSLGIRFTQPDELNDPYECHLAFDRKARSKLIEDYFNFLVEQAPDEDREKLRDIALRNEQTLLENALENYSRIRGELGVLSLSEDPLNLLMWAHYADEHRGVTIELDYSHASLFKLAGGGAEFSSLNAVQYQQNKVTGIPLPDTVVESLLVKSPDWEYEKEWRFIRTLNLLEEVKPGIFVEKLHPEAICKIILGTRFPGNRLEEIKKFTSKPEFQHVSIEKAMMIPNKFELRAVSLEKFAGILFHRDHHFGDFAKESLLHVVMEEDDEMP